MEEKAPILSKNAMAKMVQQIISGLTSAGEIAIDDVCRDNPKVGKYLKKILNVSEEMVLEELPIRHEGVLKPSNDTGKANQPTLPAQVEDIDLTSPSVESVKIQKSKMVD
jgi:hypothetical protein